MCIGVLGGSSSGYLSLMSVYQFQGYPPTPGGVSILGNIANLHFSWRKGFWGIQPTSSCAIHGVTAWLSSRQKAHLRFVFRQDRTYKRTIEGKPTSLSLPRPRPTAVGLYLPCKFVDVGSISFVSTEGYNSEFACKSYKRLFKPENCRPWTNCHEVPGPVSI